MMHFAGLFLLATWSFGEACSPEGMVGMPRSEDLVGKTYFSHAVVIGRALLITPSERFGSGAYSVKFQVDCVIKDIDEKIQGREITITEAGVIAGMCHSAEFMMGHSYIVFLKEDSSGLYKPWESPAVNSPENQALVMTTCGIQPTGSQCPSAPSGPCTPDTQDYSADQATHSHSHDHLHHADEDDSYKHSHEDHHGEGEDFDHDHDHEDHHEDEDHYDGDGHHDHDHDHHGDEDEGLDHDHASHHEGDEEFDHDHDHNDHHGETAAGSVAGKGHRDIMNLASILMVFLCVCLLQ